jgi:hypothetical protein
MDRKTIISLLLVGLLAAMLITACGTEPVSLDDVPVYPGAEAMDRGQNEFADQMVDAIKESSGKENVDTDLKLYSLPPEATWSDVASFYSAELADGDWGAQQDLTEESEIFSSLGWTRGGGASEQALVVGHISDVTGDGAFLILMLFSE